MYNGLGKRARHEGLKMNKEQNGRAPVERRVIPPLNGSKTHPLSDHALGVLERLRRQPIPTQEINPGVVNRLQRENLARVIQASSPYKTHKGRMCDHLEITAVGIERLGALMETD